MFSTKSEFSKNSFQKSTNSKQIPEIASKKLKVMPIGGLGEFGKNMTVLEYGQDIIIIDCGVMFPKKEMLGVDFVIPNIKYLEDNKAKIRAMIITHGHEDHTGATPYVAPRLGMPIYATRLTVGMIEVKLREFNLTGIKLNVIKPGDHLKFGVFEVIPFHITHSIPDPVGLIIKTPVGNLAWVTDFKFDHTPIDNEHFDYNALMSASKEGILALFSDSSNADKPGSTISEREVGKALDRIVSKAEGRVVVASFASLIHRVQQVIDAARKNRRKVAISGRSMVDNVEMAARLGYLNIPKETIVDIRKINRLRDDEVVIICTGSQGQELSALVRMSRREHKQIQIKKGDTVIISASPIPGNEQAITSTIDDLFRLGAHVIYGKEIDVHVSGHAYQEELKLLIELARPKFFIPIHGEYHLLVLHTDLACDVGIPKENTIVMENGQVLEIDKDKAILTQRRIPAGYVLVDGLGIGDVGNIVLRDRQAMAADGVLVAIVTIDKDGNLLTSPDIISRGFIYMREAETLVHNIRSQIKSLITKYYQQYQGDSATIKNLMREDLSKFIYNETKRKPMVLPVIIEVKR